MQLVISVFGRGLKGRDPFATKEDELAQLPRQVRQGCMPVQREHSASRTRPRHMQTWPHTAQRAPLPSRHPHAPHARRCDAS